MGSKRWGGSRASRSSVGVIRVNQNTIYRTALRAQKSAKAQLCTLRSKIGNLIHRRAAFLALIWSHHRMQPVIWSHHRIQRLDRLNCSPGSRAAASSFFGAGGDFKMKSWVADRGLVGSNMGRRSASCPRTGTLLARAGPASRFSPGKLHCTAWTPPALPRLTTMPRSPHSWVQGVSPDHNRRSHGRNLNTTIGSASVEFDRPSRIAGKPA